MPILVSEEKHNGRLGFYPWAGMSHTGLLPVGWHQRRAVGHVHLHLLEGIEEPDFREEYRSQR